MRAFVQVNAFMAQLFRNPDPVAPELSTATVAPEPRAATGRPNLGQSLRPPKQDRVVVLVAGMTAAWIALLPNTNHPKIAIFITRCPPLPHPRLRPRLLQFLLRVP